MNKILISLILLCIVGAGNVSAQKTHIPIDSVPENLKRNIYFESATKGDAEALLMFSYACLFSNEMNLAISCLKEASNIGSSYASLELAGAYCNGLSRGDVEHLKKDTAFAMYYYKLALKQDTTGYAHLIYGNVLATDLLVKKNIDLAITYWEKAADMGAVAAQGRLAIYHYNGESGEKNYKEAKKWIDKVLAHPDTIGGKAIKSISSNMLADMYENGLGVEQDFSKAFEIYLANSNWVKIAEYYDQGKGVKANVKKASHAYINVLEGNYTDDDYNKAIEWFEKRDDKIDPSAQFAIGNYYARKARLFDSSLARDYRKETGEYKSFYGLSPLYEKAFNYWERAAQSGHIEAIKKIIDCYTDGIGVEKDIVKATEWVRKGASKTKDKDLLFKMAWSYAKGLGVEIDSVKAVSWYKKAVKAGNITAATSLGWCYENGFGCKVDYAKAAKYYAISAEHEEALGLNNLGFSYLRGRGVEKDYEKGISLVQKSIERGRYESIPYLYHVFANGWFENTPNIPKGAEVFRALDDSLNHTNHKCIFYFHSIIANNPELATDSTELLRRYTLCFKNSSKGEDYNVFLYNFENIIINCKYPTSSDFLDAINCLRTKSNTGDTEVKSVLYKVLQTYPGCANDSAEITNLLRDLAEAGHAESQFQMAWSYAKGLGVEIDSVKAVLWYTKAAQNGHPTAAFNLAWCYDNAFGCIANPNTAFKWYLKAEELGNPRACHELGRRYLFGIGVDKDVNKGIELLTKASSSNDDIRNSAIAFITNHYWENKDYNNLISFTNGLENNCREIDFAISFLRAMAMMELGKTKEAFQELSSGWRLIKFVTEHANSMNEIVDGKQKYILVIDNVPYIEYLPADINKHLLLILDKYNIPESDFKEISWYNNRCILKTKKGISYSDCNLVTENSSSDVLFEMYRDYAFLLQKIMGYHIICDIAFENALEHCSQDINFLNSYAYRLCENNSNLDKALSISKQTIDNSPNEPYYLDTYAWILYQMNRYPEAKQYIDRCTDNIRKGDDNFEMYDHAGDIYFKCGLIKEAIEFWKKAKASTENEELVKMMDNKITSQQD